MIFMCVMIGLKFSERWSYIGIGNVLNEFSEKRGCPVVGGRSAMRWVTTKVYTTAPTTTVDWWQWCLRCCRITLTGPYTNTVSKSKSIKFHILTYHVDSVSIFRLTWISLTVDSVL